MQAVTEERLSSVPVTFSDQSAACVVLASGGYPQKYQVGKEIFGLKEGQLPGHPVTVYHACDAKKGERLYTAGGRVLGVTAVADTLEDALGKAYAATEAITFEGCHKRNDIGKKALEAKK